jgi:Flp pilus assembly pilin Flp
MLSSIVTPHLQHHRLRWSESGQGLVEYALILIFVAMAVIVMVSLFGTTVTNIYCNIINAFGDRSGVSC